MDDCDITFEMNRMSVEIFLNRSRHLTGSVTFFKLLHGKPTGSWDYVQQLQDSKAYKYIESVFSECTRMIRRTQVLRRTKQPLGLRRWSSHPSLNMQWLWLHPQPTNRNWPIIGFNWTWPSKLHLHLLLGGTIVTADGPKKDDMEAVSSFCFFLSEHGEMVNQCSCLYCVSPP